MREELFDKIHNRVDTDSVKWDYRKKLFGKTDIIPMWVADMDFPTPQVIINALQERLEHPFLAYTYQTNGYYQAIMDWLLDHHDWEVTRPQIMNIPGILPGITFAMEALTEEGDKILIQPPVYQPYFDLVRRNKRQLVLNELLLENGQYTIDFDALEEQLKDGVKVILFCSPHNPVGRVWSKDELLKLGWLCEKYGVWIFSDEIHFDLVYPGNKHRPTASINEAIADRTITFTSPVKSFNIQGMQCGALITTNKEVLNKIRRIKYRYALYTGNLMSNVAFEAAYMRAGMWLDQLKTYLEGNRKIIVDFISKSKSDIQVISPQGTYLAWLDMRQTGLSDKIISDRLINQAKVGLMDGQTYGKAGTGFQRLNFACPSDLLVQALEQIDAAFSQ